jgi:hypothetical protein
MLEQMNPKADVWGGGMKGLPRGPLGVTSSAGFSNGNITLSGANPILSPTFVGNAMAMSNSGGVSYASPKLGVKNYAAGALIK